MHLRMARKAVVGLLLALLIPTSSAFAVTSDSAVAESINVLPTLVVSGIPATLAYPDSLPGDAAHAPTVSYVVQTTDPLGWGLAIAHTDLSSGSLKIPSTALSWHSVQVNGGPSCGTNVTLDQSYSGPAGTFQDVSFVSKAVDDQCGASTLDFTLTIPSGQTPGTYSGTVTIRVATR